MTYLYNCKKCKTGKRVDYPIGNNKTGYSRINGLDQYISAGIWVNASGGGKPTVYGGDVENGLCSCCNKPMTYGKLTAIISPNHVCDAKCTNARGHNCECSCGGVNHGKVWL